MDWPEILALLKEPGFIDSIARLPASALSTDSANYIAKTFLVDRFDLMQSVRRSPVANRYIYTWLTAFVDLSLAKWVVVPPKLSAADGEEEEDEDDEVFVDRMDFSLRSDWLEYVRHKFGPWDIDRFAAEHNTTSLRFNALFDSPRAEAVDALAQDWRAGISFLLPDFHILDKVIEKVEYDDASAIIVVPEWPFKQFYIRLKSDDWARRIMMSEFLPPNVLVPNNKDCFFGEVFNRRLLVLRVGPQRNTRHLVAWLGQGQEDDETGRPQTQRASLDSAHQRGSFDTDQRRGSFGFVFGAAQPGPGRRASFGSTGRRASFDSTS